MESFNEIWQAVLEYCRQKVSKTAFNLWIDTIEFVSLEGASVTLCVPKQMHFEIVIPQYNNLLIDAFEEVIGFEVEIKYICKETFAENEAKHKAAVEEKYSPEARQQMEDYKNYQFNFDNFIVGNSNKFAYAAAKAVAENPGSNSVIMNTYHNYNPLFIYGNSGLGKTHLLQAISNEVKKKYPAMNIVYVRAEQFANEFIQAIQNKTTDEFHDKYRNDIDLLLIDDIQFIAGKDATEEEFFHTFDSLVFNGKQVVITSDRPPKDIQSLTDRLKSRFEHGLLADVQPPDYETRCEIIKRKAYLLHFEIPDQVVSYIAEKIKANIRQLEGVTNKLFALCDINEHVPTIALAQNVVKVVMEDTQPVPVTIQHIVEEVSRTTGVSIEDIYGEVRKSNISHARKITFYIVRQVTGLSYEDIGEEFKKHHSTVLYNIGQIEKEIEKNSKLARQVNDIISNIKNNQ